MMCFLHFYDDPCILCAGKRVPEVHSAKHAHIACVGVQVDGGM